MADYLGPNQTRVLDTDNRSFEEVVAQKRKPPLSSEHNLSEKLASERTRLQSKYLTPSGWAVVGGLKQSVSETLCMAGDVLASPTFTRNTFKLIALDKGVQTGHLTAWVNGWQLLVQGSSSTDENNIIILPEPPSVGHRVNFVFLEIWRKLIYTSDVIYKYGNVLYGGTNPTNDLIDPVTPIETTLRVQLQYRIRVVDDIDISTYPDGFDPNNVFVQGPLASPINTCSHAYFSPVPGDVGLWRAGAGDTVAQETLETVDGYTYAIPMFAVTRRNSHAYDPDDYSNGAGRNRASYVAGYASDRPDNKYNDIIEASDILDMRHLVSVQDNYKELCERAFQKAISGDLKTRMTYSTLGEDHYGVTLVQADAVSHADDKNGSDWLPGYPNGIRRVWSNAGVDQPDSFIAKTINDKYPPGPPAPWAPGNQVQIEASTVYYPVGTTIINVRQAYQGGAGYVTFTCSTLPSNSVLVTLVTVPSAVLPIIFEYTLRYPSGANGLTRVPTAFLECRNEDSTCAIATMDADIRVRTAAPVSTNSGLKYNTLHNAGAFVTEPYDFGHQMTYHALGNGTTYVTVPRTVEGYPILGVMSARVDSSSYRSIGVSRDSNQYTVNVGSPSPATNADVELVLYTGTKFFDLHKQGRAITDCYEMAEYRPLEPAAGGSGTTFTLDSTNKAFLGLASLRTGNGYGYAYVNGTMTTLATNNWQFPLDSTKTRPTIEFISAPPAGATIEVPALTRSAISSSEGYTVFYETTPYQGILDTTTTGCIEAVGNPIVTTAGSGAMTDYTYAQGTATFVVDSTVVNGSGTQWSSNVREGYYIYRAADTTRVYEITTVVDDDTLYIKSDAAASATGTYVIYAKDQPYFSRSNIMDRMPTLYSAADASGRSEGISTRITEDVPVLETRIVSKTQDIVDLDPNAAIIGVHTADRGRSQVSLPGTKFGLSNLGLSYETLDTTGAYQKTYQPYILNQNNDGNLYLMVVASETDNTSTIRMLNHKSDADSVDLFNLPSRPITMRRVD